MAVLIEGISVVARCNAILESFHGGHVAFSEHVPNKTLCADGELAAVAFMTPVGAKDYVGLLEKNGLRHVAGESFIDIVVVDQISGVPPFTRFHSSKEG
jgi:hypothetical protein